MKEKKSFSFTAVVRFLGVLLLTASMAVSCGGNLSQGDTQTSAAQNQVTETQEAETKATGTQAAAGAESSACLLYTSIWEKTGSSGSAPLRAFPYRHLGAAAKGRRERERVLGLGSEQAFDWLPESRNDRTGTDEEVAGPVSD